MNLLTETIDKLKDYGYTPKDVLWVGTKKFGYSWDVFKIAADKEYDDGYGSEEVNLELFVVGIDWWLERHEYDGSEWWEFKTLPKALSVMTNKEIDTQKALGTLPELLIFKGWAN